jgi:hypothetical protein
MMKEVAGPSLARWDPSDGSIIFLALEKPGGARSALDTFAFLPLPLMSRVQPSPLVQYQDCFWRKIFADAQGQTWP